MSCKTSSRKYDGRKRQQMCAMRRAGCGGGGGRQEAVMTSETRALKFRAFVVSQGKRGARARRWGHGCVPMCASIWMSCTLCRIKSLRWKRFRVSEKYCALDPSLEVKFPYYHFFGSFIFKIQQYCINQIYQTYMIKHVFK